MELDVGEEVEEPRDPVQSLPLADLHSAVTAVAPMAQGKRTKMVATMAPTKSIKKKAPTSAIRKSTRNGGAASLAMEKAQKLAAERNLDPATAVSEGSGQTEGQGLAGLGGGRRQAALRSDAV
jgi:pyruvate/2-oxoglutarate dehydrogenase complex dihydrolipoamide acyltransferase (E2) component